MDAAEFLKAWKRMCMYEIYCENCKANDYCHFINEMDEPEKLLSVVEEWAKEHPVRTRQSEFLKIFPKAKTVVADNRKVVLAICPKQVDNTFTIPSCVGKKCVECEKDYWLQEI